MRIKATTFTRPSNTTAYAAGDLVANNATAGSVVLPAFTIPEGGSVLLRRFKLWKSTLTLTNATFRIHFWEDAPTFTVGDNGVLNNAGALAVNGVANYLGSLELIAAMDRSCNDGAVGWAVPASADFGAEIIFGLKGSDATVHWAVSALAAYGPGSAEIFSGRPELIAL